MNYYDYSFNILPYGCNQDDQVIVLTLIINYYECHVYNKLKQNHIIGDY